MKSLSPTLLVVAMMAAFPAAAQSNADLLKELQALKQRVNELESKLQQTPAAPAGQAQWGMTPEQSAEFNRIAAKTEATEDNLLAQGLKGLKITGYIEPTFIYNQRQNRAGFQFLNQQSDGYYYDTSFMGAASLDLLKETDSGTLWHLTLAPNRGVGAAIDGTSIIQEASVSVPLTDDKTRFIAGQIPDWSGYEYQQPTLNPFTSHNLLYDFTLPVGYTGAGVDLKSGPWWIRTAVANLNSAVHDAGQKSPAWAFRADYGKDEFSGAGFASMIGTAPVWDADGNVEKRTLAILAEVDGYFTRGDLTVQGQLSYGQQKSAAITPDANGNRRDAQWYGISGLVGYMFTPRLQGLVRADYIYNRKNGGGLFGYSQADDRNGIGPDMNGGNPNEGANRYAITFGGKYAFNENTTVKLEYRLDGADKAVFYDVKKDDYKKLNQMLATSVVVAF